MSFEKRSPVNVSNKRDIGNGPYLARIISHLDPSFMGGLEVTLLREQGNTMGNNTQTYKDKDGNVLTTTSSANRKSYEKQLEFALKEEKTINSRINNLDSTLLRLSEDKLTKESNAELAGELGPLKYINKLTGISMDRIINWFLLVIIMVFDPLAISLVIAANFVFSQLKTPESFAIYNEKPIEPQEEPIYNERPNPTLPPDVFHKSFEEKLEPPPPPQQPFPFVPPIFKKKRDDDDVITY